MRLLLIIAVCFLAIVCVQTRDLVVGSSLDKRLIWFQQISFGAIPFVKREKDVFFTDPMQQIIKGIVCRDLDNSDASVIITAGGVGVPFVNLRFTSGRGSSLNYDVSVYA